MLVVQKTPTAAQLEYGELAINYNTSDPAIFLKDSNNNIIRISGVGNIADDGQVELPASTSPPSSPEDGNLWYNSDQGRLYIYYNDGNTSQWVDASPDSWDPSSYPDTTNSSSQSGTLDDRYVMANGDDMTGNLTLGTDKVVLNATDGSGTFEGQILTGGVPGGGNTDPGIRLRPTGSLQVMRTGSATAIAIYDTTDSTLPTTYLNADGTASFAGAISVDGGTTNENSSYGPGYLIQNRSQGIRNLWTGQLNGSNTSTILADGSATFAGALQSPSLQTYGGYVGTDATLNEYVVGGGNFTCKSSNNRSGSDLAITNLWN